MIYPPTPKGAQQLFEDIEDLRKKPKCKFCSDTGKILSSATGSDEDFDEEFCSCEKGRSKLNTLAYNHE